MSQQRNRCLTRTPTIQLQYGYLLPYLRRQPSPRDRVALPRKKNFDFPPSPGATAGKTVFPLSSNITAFFGLMPSVSRAFASCVLTGSTLEGGCRGLRHGGRNIQNINFSCNEIPPHYSSPSNSPNPLTIIAASPHPTPSTPPLSHRTSLPCIYRKRLTPWNFFL